MKIESGERGKQYEYTGLETEKEARREQRLVL